MRIPSFARRSEPTAATEDRNRDGRIDQDDERPTADLRAGAARDQVDERGTYRSRAATGTLEAPADMRTRRADADRAAAERATAERAADQAEASRLAAVRDRDREVATEPDRTTELAGPRPRSSMLATLGLIVGVTSALAVLTGVLAGYGIALGVVGLFLSIGGIAATGRRHVAGKTDALLGAALSVAAMVIGALALTGSLSWLTADANQTDHLRQWLDTHIAGRF